MEIGVDAPSVTPAASNVLTLAGVLAEIKPPVTNPIGMGLLPFPLKTIGMGLLFLPGPAPVASPIVPPLAYWAPALGTQPAPPRSIMLLTARIVMAAQSLFPLLRALRWPTTKIPTLGSQTPALLTT